tara:strand:- start:2884 stop:3225 length:342 start_codon:yes stop_codon:yes gene_type:complete
MIKRAVRVCPYALHWQRTYVEAAFHPTSAAARCAAYAASGDEHAVACVRMQEENAQLMRLVTRGADALRERLENRKRSLSQDNVLLKRLAVQVGGATPEDVMRACAVAWHRTA